jgi:sugar phosphate isomerase/epimerase
MMRGPDGAKAPFTWGEGQPTMSLLEFPRLVRERLGLDAVEICQFHLPERSDAYVAQLREALREAEVTVVNMPIDAGNISDPNAPYREEDLREIEEWMRVAAALGSRMVRVNAGNPMARETVPLEVTIASYRRLSGVAVGLGLRLLVENHGGFSSDPDVLVRLLTGVGSDRLQALLDIGNFEPLLSAHMARWQGREAPAHLDLEPLYTAIGRVAPYAGMVHAKTFDFDAAGEPTELDVRRALRVVRDAGYRGPISLEYEGTTGDPWENTRRTRDIVVQVFGDEEARV